MRHTSDHPRTSRFVRVRRAVIRDDRCVRCVYPLDHHRHVPTDTENPTHCPFCGCPDCGADDYTTRRDS